MQDKEYVLLTGDISVGASKQYVDLFNSSASGQIVYIDKVYIRPTSDVAVSGVVSARFNLLRTSTVATSGQSIGYASASETAATIYPLNSRQPALPSGITARTLPVGGSTVTARIGTAMAFPEETNAAVTLSQNLDVLKADRIVLNPNEGILIKQGTVATVGSFEIEIHFSVEEAE